MNNNGLITLKDVLWQINVFCSLLSKGEPYVIQDSEKDYTFFRKRSVQIGKSFLLQLSLFL